MSEPTTESKESKESNETESKRKKETQTKIEKKDPKKEEKKPNHIALVISDIVAFIISAFSAAVIVCASYDLSLVLKVKTTNDCQQIPANVNMRFDPDEYPYKVPGGKYYTMFETVIEPFKYIFSLIGLYKTKGDRRVSFWYRKTYEWSSDFFSDMIISSWVWMRYALYVFCLFIRDIYRPDRDFKHYEMSLETVAYIAFSMLWPLTLFVILGYYIVKLFYNMFNSNEWHNSYFEQLSSKFFTIMKANLFLNFSAGIITTLSMIAAYVGVYGCFIGAIRYSIFTRFILPAIIVICIPFAVVLFLIQFLHNIGLFYISVYQKRKKCTGFKNGLRHFLQPIFILPTLLFKSIAYLVGWFGKHKWEIGEFDELFISFLVYLCFTIFYIVIYSTVHIKPK